jgi:probable rRNA maturation factor
MTVEISRRGAGRSFVARELRQIALTTLALLNLQNQELSIVLVGDKEMRQLNFNYRRKKQTTDVLSFPPGMQPPRGVALLGDVIISVEQARRQAKEQGKTLKDEIAVLLIHGLLHLLGYDHERSPRQAKIMAGLERKLYRHLCDQGLLKL